MRTKGKADLRPIHITERDKKLLRIVSDYGLVTTEHIRYLLYPSISRTRKRLRQLWQHDWLLRIDRPTKMGEGTKTKIYRCSNKAKRLIGENESTSTTAGRSRSVTSTFAEHQLAVNRFRVCLELLVQRNRSLYLLNWIPDRGVKFRIENPIKIGHGLSVLIPDATFTLWSSNRSFGYFLELDRGTAPLKRIRAKILGYHALFLKPEDQLVKPHSRFRVLFVFDSESRMKRILCMIKALPQHIRRPDIFLLTRSGLFDYGRPEAIMEPIWYTVTTARKALVPQPLIPSIRRSRLCQVNHQCTEENPKDTLCSADAARTRLPGAGAETTR